MNKHDDIFDDTEEYDDNIDNDDELDDILEKKEKGESFIKSVFYNSLYILFALLVSVLFVTYVGQRTVVQGSSMNPTLIDQDNLIVDKLSYRFSEPERFDIIVFPYEYEKHTYYIKRVIGLPGEEVKIDFEGNIYINNKLLVENYGAETIIDPGTAWDPIVLGDDEYFVLGDNRNHSSDSRNPAVGLIKRDKIIGRACFRIYPFSSFGSINSGK